MVTTELVVRAQSARAVPLIRIARWKSHDPKHESKALYSPTCGHFCASSEIHSSNTGHFIFQKILYVFNIRLFENVRLMLIENSTEQKQL
jgi:hypothetical protein